MLSNIIFLVLKVFFAGFFGLLFMGLMRKLAARFQHRIGPPIWQPFLDVAKLFSKENIKSKRESPYLIWGPVISLTAYISIILLLPISGFFTFSFYGSIIYVIYLFLMGVAGYVIAGFASGNPYGGIGSSRELVQAFGFELPFITALLVPTVFSFSLTTGYFFLYPLAFLAFLIAVQGELALPPFHIPHAEQELVAGVFTELSGYKLGMFELAYAFKLFALSALVTILFLGGGTFWIFLGKCFIVIIVLTLVRVLFARMTIDQCLRVFWLVAAPLALLDLIRVLLIA
ncbi:MAG: NADH-quinone oxidoreductase subunit H [Candidatus Aenigmarchaeota archaeon]|nr:NADH-quinone oxidoreductase subunit H [Candidatus Aenigmarchaeota archaeon]